MVACSRSCVASAAVFSASIREFARDGQLRLGFVGPGGLHVELTHQPGLVLTGGFDLDPKARELAVARRDLPQLGLRAVALEARLPPVGLDLVEPGGVVFGAPAAALHRNFEVALGDAQRLLGPHLLAVRPGLRLLLVAKLARVLVEQAVVVEERAAHAVELVDNLGVLGLDALDLGREVLARRLRRRVLGLGGALLLRGPEPLDLTAQVGRGQLGLRAGR